MPRPRDPLLNAESLAAAGKVVEREYPIADFGRLADRLAQPEGMVSARLGLSMAEGIAVGELRIHATLLLTCQRCLGPMRRDVESEARLAFVASDDTPVPAEHEVVACDPCRLDLAGLVEDELLLSLPHIARHAEGEACAPPAGVTMVGRPEQAGTAAEPMRRPFAGLKDLLKH